MYPSERILIDKLLKEKKLEYLKCKRLYEKKYSEVIAILELPYWNDEKFKHLLTSSIWYSNSNEVQNIINIFSKLNEDQKKIFMPLLTSTIWNSNSQEVQNIIDIFSKLNEDQKKIFMPLLTSTIWNSSSENIKNIINSKIWENEFYIHLLSKSIWNKNLAKIEAIIETMEELNLQEYITISCLKFSPIQIKALYHYLIDHNLDVIIDNKLNPIFNISPSTLLKKYGINLKELVNKEKEREQQNGLSK